MGKRKVRVYIAASLDGYIAHSDGDIDWLDSVARPDEDYGYAAFIETIDTVIMGRKTYEKVLSFGGEFPHADRDCYVLSRTERPSEGKYIFTADLPTICWTKSGADPAKTSLSMAGPKQSTYSVRKG